MTRVEILAEMAKCACDWRVPLDELKQATSRDGTQRAARIDFMRRMFRLGVDHGHTAWALETGLSTVRRWYGIFKRREAAWWQ